MWGGTGGNCPPILRLSRWYHLTTRGVVVGEVVDQKVVLVVETFQAFHAFPGNQEVASFHVVAYLQVARKKKNVCIAAALLHVHSYM